MSSLKVFGIIILVLSTGMMVIPALAQQTQAQVKTDCINTCDGTPDQTKDQLQDKTQDCVSSLDQLQDQDRLTEQDRDKICLVGTYLKIQQKDQTMIRSC